MEAEIFEGEKMLEKVKSMAIINATAYQEAMEFGNKLTVRQSEIVDFYATEKAITYRAWKDYCDRENEHLAPFIAAKGIIDALCSKWRRNEKEKAEQAAKAAREAAYRQAENERLAKAEVFEKQNKPALALQILDAPIMPKIHAVPMAAIPITENASFRENWKMRIVDEALIPREFLMPDEKKINQIVKAMKSLTRIPGVEVFSEETTVRRVK